jgi:hypothetical protein
MHGHARELKDEKVRSFAASYTRNGRSRGPTSTRYGHGPGALAVAGRPFGRLHLEHKVPRAFAVVPMSNVRRHHITIDRTTMLELPYGSLESPLVNFVS